MCLRCVFQSCPAGRLRNLTQSRRGPGGRFLPIFLLPRQYVASSSPSPGASRRLRPVVSVSDADVRDSERGRGPPCRLRKDLPARSSGSQGALHPRLSVRSRPLCDGAHPHHAIAIKLDGDQHAVGTDVCLQRCELVVGQRWQQLVRLANSPLSGVLRFRDGHGALIITRESGSGVMEPRTGSSADVNRSALPTHRSGADQGCSERGRNGA